MAKIMLQESHPLLNHGTPPQAPDGYVLGNHFIGTGYRCRTGSVKVASPRGRANWTEHVLH